VTAVTGQLLSAAASGPSPLWYATRATGVVAFVLLTGTVVLGVAGVARLEAPRWPRVVTQGLHRNLSLLAVGFVLAHVLTTVADSYTHISLISAVVPFSASYRPLWLSLGAVALDMMLAVVVTSLLRDRLSYRSWRAVHLLAYACWPIALWHGLGTGTDSRLPLLLLLDALCIAAVAAAAWWRLRLAENSTGRAAALAAVPAVGLATVVFVLVGPLQPGWSRRAGTPVALLGETVRPPASGPAANGSGSPSPATSPAHALFRGRVTRSRVPGSGEVTITVRSRTTGSRPEYLVIVLRGAPEGQGLALSSGSVRLGPASAPARYSGPVVALNGQQLVADLRGPGGTAQRADISLAVQSGTATGQISTQPGGAS
jgi:sulfoxide reductase heme-binding subunit YedZ